MSDLAVKLVILRHGNTFDKGDVVTRVGGRTDLPLSNSGKQQAAAISEVLKAQGFAFTQIYCSPLKRTQMTAEAVRDGTAPDIAITALEGLREIDYGPDENKPEDDVLARIGQPALDAWEKHAHPPPGWRVDVQALRGFWRKLFDQLAAREAGAQGPVLAVTSNGVARFALDAADSIPPDAPRKLKTARFGVVAIDIHRRAEIISWNTPHSL